MKCWLAVHGDGDDDSHDDAIFFSNDSHNALCHSPNDIEEKSGKFGLQRLSVLLANNAFGWRCDGPSVVGLFLECRKTA